MPGQFRFSFGPWNIHEGADPFGPQVRKPFTFDDKLKVYKDLGFEGVQFHDDDVVPDIDSHSSQEVLKKARDVKKRLDERQSAGRRIAAEDGNRMFPETCHIDMPRVGARSVHRLPRQAGEIEHDDLIAELRGGFQEVVFVEA